MTPSQSHNPPADDTQELLELIADDTRRQLRRWINLSILLRFPLIFPPATTRRSLILVNEAITTLRTMRGCAKDALRSFHKRRYDRCVLALAKMDHLHGVLAAIDREAASTLIRSIFERRDDAGRN